MADVRTEELPTEASKLGQYGAFGHRCVIRLHGCRLLDHAVDDALFEEFKQRSLFSHAIYQYLISAS